MYQFLPFEEISIVSNSSHLKLRQDMSDTIWKYYPSFDLIWLLSGFRGEYYEMNFCQNQSNLNIFCNMKNALCFSKTFSIIMSYLSWKWNNCSNFSSLGRKMWINLVCRSILLYSLWSIYRNSRHFGGLVGSSDIILEVLTEVDSDQLWLKLNSSFHRRFLK